MRIAFVTETWTPSVDGVLTRLRVTIDQLAERGHQMLVVAPEDRDRTDPNEQTPATDVVTVPAWRFSFLANRRPFGLPWLTRRVQKAIAEFEPDVVHVLSPYILGRTGVIAAKNLEVPLVTSFHQDLGRVAEHANLPFLYRPIWWYMRHQHSQADVNLVTSRAMLDLLAEQRIESVQLWPFGVDLRRFDPARRTAEARRKLVGDDTDSVIALSVGRLAPEKGLRRLYEVARTPGIALVVVGEGSMRAEMERELAGENVHFTGWLAGDDLADAYAAADVFTFASNTETLGFVMIEAMASGLPVVATRSEPTAEILGVGNGGVMVEPDGWQHAGEEVLRIGSPGPEREQAAAAARTRALSWDWGAATEALLDIYHELLSDTVVSAPIQLPAQADPQRRAG